MGPYIIIIQLHGDRNCALDLGGKLEHDFADGVRDWCALSLGCGISDKLVMQRCDDGHGLCSGNKSLLLAGFQHRII